MKVGVIMGSSSDWDTMKEAVHMLEYFGIDYETEVVSAHRTPEKMFTYATHARDNNIRIIIAGAGGAAHLPGMVASMTNVPVIGVPIQSKALNGLDSLLSIAQMPGGVPVATTAIGKAGSKNAGILAAKMIAVHDEMIYEKLEVYSKSLEDKVEAMQGDIK